MIINFKVQCQKIQWSNPTRAPVEGSVGEVYAQFFVDSEWEGRTIFAVFSNEEGNAPLPEPVLWTGDPIKVPASVLVDGVLRVGLVGVKDGNTLTTQYMARGVPVHRSGGTGGEAVDPDPALWEQVLITIGNLSELNTADKSSLVAAINEANRTKVNSEDIKAAVDDYLEKNPIAAAEIMTGATAGTAGKSGLVPAPAAGDEGKVLHGDGTWKEVEASGGDYIPIPETAEVGQTIRVSAVDENGKPTAWEAVDMASGGGSGGIRRIARVVTEANTASIEATGLSTTAEVLSLRIYNPGSSCGGGLTITINGVTKGGYTGTIAGTSEAQALVRAWLYHDDGTLYGRARMANEGINVYEWPDPGEITSIAVASPYNDGTSKYFQAGTIVEIYEGVYPNVN